MTLNDTFPRLFISTLVLSLAVSANAQTAGEPQLTVGGGAGIANPLHGDFDFTPPTWNVSVRGHTGPHFIVEGFFAGWRHRSSETFGLSGQRTEQQTTRTVRVIGVNFLGRSRGRLSFYGGGGPGYWLHSSRFTQTPNVVNTFDSSAFAVQGVGGFDAAITSRLIAFGQFQAVFPIEDPGIGHTAITAGLRFALK
jgi:hypothetical protein